MPPIIKVENLSKQYRLGNVGTGTIKDDLKRSWYKLRGKEDPFLRIGETNDRSSKGKSDYVWALKDINFEVQAGEVWGIIGRNGAGKSTLLKILSRVTEPTKGRITMKGRVASLLEVGTGMHPDLTGRENIYLNGAILGMTRKEITSKLDEIIDFSGVERYIDTPVKRYSSGMHVRLGFAVAAHLEPEILIVDEVLAVGDAEFQKKCLGKMKQVSVSEGRTVLFVSHNMSAIQKLCDTCLLMNQGEILKQTNTKEATQLYLSNKSGAAAYKLETKKDGGAFVLHAFSERINGESANQFSIGEKFRIRLSVHSKTVFNQFICGIGIVNFNEVPVNTSWMQPAEINPGIYEVSFEQSELILATGKYLVQLGLMNGKEVLEFVPDAFEFEIFNAIEMVGDTVLQFSSDSGIVLNQMKSTFKST